VRGEPGFPGLFGLKFLGFFFLLVCFLAELCGEGRGVLFAAFGGRRWCFCFSSSSSSSGAVASRARFSAFFGVAFFGVALAFVALVFLAPKSDPSDSDVYLTGAFARAERRVDMVCMCGVSSLNAAALRNK
jgi:hypothetical protein